MIFIIKNFLETQKIIAESSWKNTKTIYQKKQYEKFFKHWKRCWNEENAYYMKTMKKSAEKISPVIRITMMAIKARKKELK